MKRPFLTVLGLLCLIISCSKQSSVNLADKDRIQPYAKNPRYWQYKGDPVLLLGITYEDWLQIPDPEPRLAALKNAGGNFVECFLFPADKNKINPFIVHDRSGLFSGQMNTLFWDRLQSFLLKTAKMDIVVQLHILPGKQSVTENDISDENWIYNYADTLLSRTLLFGHILYDINPGSSVPCEQSVHWIDVMKTRASERHAHIVVSVEPRDRYNNISASDSGETKSLLSFFTHPKYNSLSGQAYWDAFQKLRDQTSENPIPIISSGSKGPDKFARFWQNILGGMAAVLYEENPDSIFGSTALASLKSARMLQEKLDIFNSSPEKMDQLSRRKPDEAYMTCILNKQYALFFPREGSVDLDLKNMTGIFEYRWLDIMKSEWRNPMQMPGGGISRTITPGPGPWITLYSK